MYTTIVALRQARPHSTTKLHKVLAHDTDPHNNRVDFLAKAAAATPPTHWGQWDTDSLHLNSLIEYFAPPTWLQYHKVDVTLSSKPGLTLKRSTNTTSQPTTPTGSITKAVRDIFSNEAAQAYALSSTQCHMDLTLYQGQFNSSLRNEAIKGNITDLKHPDLHREIIRMYTGHRGHASRAIKQTTCPLCHLPIPTDHSTSQHALFHCTAPHIKQQKLASHFAFTRGLLRLGSQTWWDRELRIHTTPSLNDLLPTLPPPLLAKAQHHLRSLPHITPQYDEPTIRIPHP